MKSTFTIRGRLLLIGLSLIGFSALAQQPTNKQINYEIRPYQFYYNGTNDTNSDGEVTYEMDIANGSGNWYNDICWTWACASTPCTWVNSDPNGFLLWGSDWAWNTTFDFHLTGWEDDDGQNCTYSAGDDDFYDDDASFTNAGPAPISQNAARWPSAWYSNDNDNTNGWLFPYSNDWDIMLQTAWRYTHGDNCGDPLQFGVINANSTVYHFNSTNQDMAADHSQGTVLTYTNTIDNSSEDVFYEFTINDQVDVTISTEHNLTDFDTYLRLYDSGCVTQLDYNDDIGGGVYQSRINTQLLPGTYKVVVEGYNANEGNFYLEIITGPALVGITEYEEANFAVYPNPANDQFTLDLTELELEAQRMELVNPLGQVVLQESLANRQNDKVQLNVQTLPAGTYVLQLYANDQLYNKMVVVQ